MILTFVLKNWKLISIGAIVFIILVYTDYRNIKTIEDLKVRLQSQQQVYNQNQKAYQEEINEKADSIQILTSRVFNLNAENSDLRKQYNVYKQQVTILIDSVNSTGKALAGLLTDSSGNKIARVSFSGNKNIFEYSGYTDYYFPPSTLGSDYNISISTRPFDIYNKLYYDFNDKTIKINTTTDASGIKFLVNNTIDSSIYTGLVQTIVKTKTERIYSTPPIGLLFKANLGLGYGNVRLTNGQFNVMIDADVVGYYKHINIDWHPFQQYISAGVFYNFDIGHFVKSVF